MEYLFELLSTDGFPPRWYCGSAWTPFLGWVHILSDLAIFLSYTAIPIFLIFLVIRRRDVPFTPILWLFAGFILLCGLSHLIEATIFWIPWYRLSGLIKFLTALISIFTATILIKNLPLALSIPSIIQKKQDLEKILLLRISEEKFFEDFYENAPDMFASISNDRRVINCNSKLVEGLGYEKSEIIGKEVLKFYHPDCLEQVKKGVELFQKQEYLENFELEFKRKDGSKLSVMLNLTPVTDEEGKVLYKRAVWRDITSLQEAVKEIKKINHELIEQQVRLQSLTNRLNVVLNSTADAIITIGKDGIIESFNHAAELIFKYSRDEATGKPIDIIASSENMKKLDQNGYVEFLRSFSSRVKGFDIETFCRKKDGTLFPVEYSLNEVEIEGEVKFISNIRDISQRKFIENKLKLAYTELEEFVYIASHDLKEPLRGIHNYATFLIEDYENLIDSEGKDKLYTLKYLTTRLDKFIDDLLYYSRVGKTELSIKKVDLNELVQDVIQSLQITVKEKGIEIKLHELPSIICDETRVAEVFRNLITNAMKYNDKAEKWIDIGCNLIENNKGNSIYVFYVKDNGIGISDKYFDVIFKIFKRLHGREKYGGGSGAGLTIVKKIINQHGGDIWVESVIKEGTTFYFTLPQGNKEDERTFIANN